MISKTKLIASTWDAVRKTINKFKENPYYFFTESDIHSYFYHCMYNSTFEVKRNNRRIYLVHREYPTNFRYSKKRLTTDGVYDPDHIDTGNNRTGRGHYDMAIINPDFANKAKNIDHIINKNISDTKDRYNGDIKNFKDELLFAIEFKYIISNSKNWIEQVKIDNKKLEFSLKYGAEEAINLVFCNNNYHHINDLKNAISSSPPGVKTILIQTYFDKNTDIKELPRLLSNNQIEFEKNGITAF